MSSKYHVKKLEKKNDHLSILWKDNFESKFHFMWLRDHCYTDINNRKYKSPYVFWDGKLKKNLKKIIVDHNSVIKNEKYLSKWLNLLHTYGFALIKNAPTSKKSAFKILNRISHHRETFFGTPFEVINIPKPNNTAYTVSYTHLTLPTTR